MDITRVAHNPLAISRTRRRFWDKVGTQAGTAVYER
jgi:hypothetical protein